MDRQGVHIGAEEDHGLRLRGRSASADHRSHGTQFPPEGDLEWEVTEGVEDGLLCPGEIEAELGMLMQTMTQMRHVTGELPRILEE